MLLWEVEHLIKYSLNSLNNGEFNFSNDTNKQDFELLIKALDASLSGIIITDNQQPDNPIIYCNRAFEEITGYSRAEIIGHNCRFLQKDDRDQTARAKLKAAIEQGNDLVVDIRNYKKDGTLFWKITNGNAPKGMPSFSRLPELQRWQLVLFLRRLKTMGPAAADPAK